MMREGLERGEYYKTVEVASSMKDLEEAVADECSTCVLLYACIMAFSKGQLDSEAANEISISFRAGNTLHPTVLDANPSAVSELEISNLPGK